MNSGATQTSEDLRDGGRALWYDKVGLLVAPIAVAAMFLPFMSFAANRIVEAESRSILASLPQTYAVMLLAALGVAALLLLVRTSTKLRAVSAGAAIALLLVAAGLAADHLSADANTYARVRPASGFWLLLFAFSLGLTDAITRLRLRPTTRIALATAALGALLLLVSSGLWSNISFLKEYENQAQLFWREARQHITLSVGSMLAACIVGIPLGITCQNQRGTRSAILNTLTFVQTVPSLALFGLLIAPLSWLASNVPVVSALGIRGIGTAPALVALFAYSLLPITGNTLAGLEGVSTSAREAARGMGMTRHQRLLRIELPLALPAILAGIRIVLVQNIGLTTIAALIGGGGFGVFVFQGLGQASIDLVLLGVIPTIILAFASAVLMDAFIDMSRKERREHR
ncbi:ABC transporter permease [Nitratireductor aestuarii]|uniref:ABC transporter permease n=1 Tax=Nitratireductor aestuarii TaxID=1735103 RepID=A0A916W7M5_9HYPH|nr:ABC transporter permease [Nitratireductor aestuarii]GGA74508.1 ABC transporter permease [Nitratireductor aestuarii]